VAEHEVGHRARLAAVAGHHGRQLADQLDALRDLVHHVLRVEEAQARRVHLGREGEQLRHLVVLAPEPEHEHPAGVRVAEQPGEHPLRGAQVVAELAAAVRVREGVHAVHARALARVPLGRRARDALGRRVHAPDGVDDPHLVARADAAVARR
jgi:hypothetical protein